MLRAAALACAAALGLSACDLPPAAAPAQGEGAALENCTRAIRARSGASVRIVRVDIFEEQRGVIRATDAFRTDYTCFTDPSGRAVNVVRKRDPLF